MYEHIILYTNILCSRRRQRRPSRARKSHRDRPPRTRMQLHAQHPDKKKSPEAVFLPPHRMTLRDVIKSRVMYIPRYSVQLSGKIRVPEVSYIIHYARASCVPTHQVIYQIIKCTLALHSD